MYRVACPKYVSGALQSLLDCCRADSSLVRDIIVGQTGGEISQGFEFNFCETGVLPDCADQCFENVCHVLELGCSQFTVFPRTG